MKKILFISWWQKMLAFSPLFFLFISCETEFIPEVNNDAPQFVVEGYIEAGPNANPPFVLLTRTIPFFSTIDSTILSDVFVHDALVEISDGVNTIQLEELCFADLNEAQQDLAAAFLGLGDVDSIGINFCIYIEQSLTPTLGVEGNAYSLNIEAEGQTLSATTTIPTRIPLDSLRYFEINDSLVELRCFITDPAEETSFYRYFTQRNSEPLTAGLTSVIDDEFFNGSSFEFPLARGQQQTDPIDLNTYGYFWKGDTVQVKWCTLDQAHYQFWSTLEFNSAAEGPFSSFTRVESNIEGGLGVWGGYGASTIEIIIPE